MTEQNLNQTRDPLVRMPGESEAAWVARRDATPVIARDDFEQRRSATKAAFDAEQAARQERFDREHEAIAHRADREITRAEQEAERNAAILKAEEENDIAAMAHGRLNEYDLVLRRERMRQQTFDCHMPWQVPADGEVTVKMAFPRDTILLLANGAKVYFHKGYCDVPVSIADHQYLFDAGAERVGQDGRPEPVETRAERVKAAAAVQRPGETDEAFAARTAALAKA